MRKEYDFSNAKRAKDVPHLSKLQAEAKGKTCKMMKFSKTFGQRQRLKG